MASITVTLDTELLPWQEDVVAQAKRFNVLAKGRRTGGTSLVEDLLLELAVDGWPIGWLSVTDKLLYESWSRMCEAVEPLVQYRSEKNHRLELYGGGIIECWSCQSGVTTRSRKYKGVGVDEAAHVPDFQRIWEQELRPSLMDLKGGAWFPSSPNGHNYFKELFDKGQDPEQFEWASWQIPTYANPLLDPAEIESMRNELSELSFQQEVEAKFVTMAGQCFKDFQRGRHLARHIYDERLGPVYLGVDFGYRTFAWVALQRDSQGTLRIFACAEWKNIDTESAGRRIADLPWASGIGLIGCDPAGDAVNLQTGIGDVQVLRAIFPNAKVSFSTAPTHRSPEWRAARIRDLLWSAAKTRRLTVDPVCASVIKMLEASVYPKIRPGSGEKQEPVKDGVVDHIRDALGFIIVNLMFKGESVMGGERKW